MRLILTADDGTVLDSVEVDREDWYSAQQDARGAFALISELQAGEQGS